MDFQETFLNALKTNTVLTKAIFIQNYLPNFLSTPMSVINNLPYVQAYGNIHSSYPYYYEQLNLDSYCIIYTECGTGTLILDNRNYTLVPGTIAFIDCLESHRIEVKQSPWDYKVFFIKGDPIPFLHHTLTYNYGSLHTLSLGSSVPNVIQKFYAQLNKNSEKIYLQTKFIVDILLEVIMEKKQLEESDTYIPDYLIEIKHDFDSNYQQSFSLDDLELKYHISKYRICHGFTEQFNISPIQYLNHKRIEVAKETLIYTDKRINEIGRMIGLENTNHFIRIFKQQTGVTPLVFRKHPPALTYLH